MDDEISLRLDDILARENEGWRVAGYVTVVGLERVNRDGAVDTDHAVYVPANQPDYTTIGLLAAAIQEAQKWKGTKEP